MKGQPRLVYGPTAEFGTRLPLSILAANQGLW